MSAAHPVIKRQPLIELSISKGGATLSNKIKIPSLRRAAAPSEKIKIPFLKGVAAPLSKIAVPL